jgi:5'-nucleotidase
VRILVTNDDGIHADGLSVCEAIARSLSDDVWTVAPESDQSGVAHSLSLNDPLRLRDVGPQRFAVLGTPTDCVIMALKHILPSPPNLIISGVNRGQNVAEDVTYSGTVAAAMEGTILGVPSIALSQAYGPGGRENIHWDCARQHAPDLVRKVLDIGIEPGTLININFPNCAPQDVAGTRITTQGQRDANFLRIEARADGRMIPYYWIGFQRGQYELGHGTDLEALSEKHISLTPLRLNLTDEPNVTRFAVHF